METKVNWDTMGIITSVGCAIHCALLPLVASSLPIFGINIIHNAYFEWGMILLAFAIGSYSLFHGYLKHHRSLVPVYLFMGGFMFLLFKQFFHSFGNWFLLVALPLIVAAHYYNYRLCQRVKCTSPHHKH